MNNIRHISISAVFWGSLICFVISVLINALQSSQSRVEIIILSGLLVVSYYCSIIFFSSNDNDRFNEEKEDEALKKFVFFSHSLFVILAGLSISVLPLNSSLTLIFLIILSFLGMLSWLINATYLKWDENNWQKNLIGIVFDISSFLFVVYLLLYPDANGIEAGVVGFVMVFILHVSINLFKPFKNAIIQSSSLFGGNEGSA